MHSSDSFCYTDLACTFLAVEASDLETFCGLLPSGLAKLIKSYYRLTVRFWEAFCLHLDKVQQFMRFRAFLSYLRPLS